MTSVNARTIGVDGTIAPYEYQLTDSLSALQSGVGGLVDCIDMTHPRTGNVATLWINDEGKLLDLEANVRATILARGFGVIDYRDYIAGPAVITGMTFDDEGEYVTGDIPSEWASFIDACFE